LINNESIKTICGLDEAGRGALAGPIVIAGVVFPRNFKFSNVVPNIVAKDSKELSIKQREELFNIIKKYSIKIILEIIPAREINKKGINWANTIGFRRIIQHINVDQYIVDGRWKLTRLGNKKEKTSCVIKGDTKIPAVLSAGIVAKVERDKIMKALHSKHPQYKWETNTGHGTRFHIEAIIKNGITKYHKDLFVKTALENYEKKFKKYS
jgi:ribonuclease HII